MKLGNCYEGLLFKQTGNWASPLLQNRIMISLCQIKAVRKPKREQKSFRGFYECSVWARNSSRTFIFCFFFLFQSAISSWIARLRLAAAMTVCKWVSVAHAQCSSEWSCTRIRCAAGTQTLLLLLYTQHTVFKCTNKNNTLLLNSVFIRIIDVKKKLINNHSTIYYSVITS